MSGGIKGGWRKINEGNEDYTSSTGSSWELGYLATCNQVSHLRGAARRVRSLAPPVDRTWYCRLWQGLNTLCFCHLEDLS